MCGIVATRAMGGAAVAVVYNLLLWTSLSTASSSSTVPPTTTVVTVDSSTVTPILSPNGSTEGLAPENVSSVLNATTAVESGGLNTTTNGTIIGSNIKNFLSSTDAVLRAIYVACGILTIIIIYVFIRIRRKNKKTKWHKYGILTNSEVEMTPLDQGEDDEEATMFDARTFRKEYK